MRLVNQSLFWLITIRLKLKKNSYYNISIEQEYIILPLLSSGFVSFLLAYLFALIKRLTRLSWTVQSESEPRSLFYQINLARLISSLTVRGILRLFAFLRFCCTFWVNLVSNQLTSNLIPCHELTEQQAKWPISNFYLVLRTVKPFWALLNAFLGLYFIDV